MPRYSVTQLTTFLGCEHASALKRAHDARLPGAPAGVHSQKLAALHGEAHEDAYLATLRSRHGEGVVEIEAHISQEAAHEATLRAMDAGAAVIYQGALLDELMYGRADFLIRTEAGTYEPWDTKLARSVKVDVLVQLAGYAQLLERCGRGLPEQMHVVLGTGAERSFEVRRYLPYLHVLRERFERSWAEPARIPVPLFGEKQEGCTGCRFELHCEEERTQARDLSLVAGITGAQRQRLRAAGFATLEALAAASSEVLAGVEGIGARALARLQHQASLQAAQDAGGKPEVVVIAQEALHAIPEPSDGDLFFDLEGDPHVEGGLEYLWGFVCRDGCSAPHGAEGFTAFWAHTAAEERVALQQSIAFVEDHRERFPEMHVYHYNAYEKTVLLRLSAREGLGESAVDEWLREGVLVDLYRNVQAGIRVSQPSYSIKYLEAYYREKRTGEVVSAGASIEVYEALIPELDAARRGDAEAAQRAEEVLQTIADYNRDDCSSTLGLRDWLHGLRSFPAPVIVEVVAPTPPAPSPLQELRGRLEASVRPEVLAKRAAPTPDEELRLQVAGLLEYHRREAKQKWQQYFQRIEAEVEELAEDDECYVGEWQAGSWLPKEKGKRNLRVEYTTTLPPGKSWPYRGTGFAGLPLHPETGKPQKFEEARVAGSTVTLVLSQKADPHELVPAPPEVIIPHDFFQMDGHKEALQAVGESLLRGDDELVSEAALHVVAKRPPRLREDVVIPMEGDLDPVVAEICERVDRLDRSYLAVQGPPGAGKSYTGARLLAHLVAQGRSVGVCANSHKAVENLLEAAVKAGVTPMAKKPSDVQEAAMKERAAAGVPEPELGWKWENDIEDWHLQRTGSGHVVAGTVWSFARTAMRENPLDVLIIDEAGQFSLADLLVVGASAHNLVLLGDPQQLPQVVQGSHPPGASDSALERVLDGAAVIGSERGMFLAETRRMHPALCLPVSQLSYEGRLDAHPSTGVQEVEGVSPGLHAVALDHEGCTEFSQEEAEAVTSLVTDLLGRSWVDTSGAKRAITPADIIITAPYNAQVRLITELLQKAGPAAGSVDVGSVDRFQGREAAVSIVSLTSSTGASRRGLEFVCSPNRMNVALSRGRALGVLIHSRQLLETPVRTQDELLLLSGLAGLIAQGCGGSCELLSDRLGSPA